MSKSSYELAVEEAKMWINNNSCHMQDCHEYCSKYMHDLSIVNRISDWNHFRSIVTDLGYDIYIDVCDNEWFEVPRLIENKTAI